LLVAVAEVRVVTVAVLLATVVAEVEQVVLLQDGHQLHRLALLVQEEALVE
jgi:hypothetical protein